MENQESQLFREPPEPSGECIYGPVIGCPEPATRRLSIEDSAVLVMPGYGAQRHNYQEGHRQRFLQEQYLRLAVQDAMAAEPDVPHSADLEATDGAMPEGEMPEYIQEEDEEEDLLYFVQPQQRSHGDIYLASSVGDTNRVR